jgi:hypothetical protein
MPSCILNLLYQRARVPRFSPSGGALFVRCRTYREINLDSKEGVGTPLPRRGLAIILFRRDCGSNGSFHRRTRTVHDACLDVRYLCAGERKNRPNHVNIRTAGAWRGNAGDNTSGIKARPEPSGVGTERSIAVTAPDEGVANARRRNLK